MARLSNADAEFLRGFACAVGTLARDCDQPTMAADICNCNGVTLRDLRRALVERFDLPRTLVRELGATDAKHKREIRKLDE